MASLERRLRPEFYPLVDPLVRWKPSNLEPLHRVLPEDSPLHIGVSVLDRVMFACSNTEFKSIMLVYGLNRNPTKRYAIHKRIEPLLPDSWSEKAQPANIGRIIRAFMCPPGFAEEFVENRFAITSQGDTVAKDSAAFLLRRALDLGIPLGPILQERTEDVDTPTRAYVTRIAILIALQEGVSSQAKLYDKMGGSLAVLAKNLRVLAEKKLISYESINPEVKGQHVYHRSDLLVMSQKAGILARNVFKYFELNETGNNYVVAQALGREHTHDIGRALRQLARAGVIKPAKWSWSDRQSDARITPLGERLIDGVIKPLLLAYTGNEESIQRLAEARNELERNPALATEALDQYKRQRLLIPEVETQQAILTFIREHGYQRRKQILARIGYKAHPQLRHLVANGQLKIVRDGNASFYMLPDAEDQPTRVEEIITFGFNPPADLFEKQEHRIRDEYRRELDTVEFWQRLQREIQHVLPDRHTARSFFLKFDPRYEDWEQRWYNGIFSNHIRALWSLGIEQPWEFIRVYKPDGAPRELQETIAATQDLINKVFPAEGKSRIFNRRYIDRLETPEFWRELIADVQSVPPATKIESFMLRFDPNIEGKLKPGHQYGKYYPLRSMVRKHTGNTSIALLTSYRPPKGAPLELLLVVREAQATLRDHLIVRNLPIDDFSDIDELRRRQAEEMQKRKESQIRLLSLKSFFEQFQEFNNAEMSRLAALTAERVQDVRANIKGFDTDDASLASIGFETKKYEGSELMADTFPAELRAAYLVYAFEQWRNGVSIPQIPTSTDQRIFTNSEVKNILTLLQGYLIYYENQAKKKNPNATLPASMLIDQLKKYVKALT